MLHLRELRIKKGLTQKELAIKLGVTTQTILNWETDVSIPNVYQAFELAKMLDVTIEHLCGIDLNDAQIKDMIEQFAEIPIDEYVEFIKANIKSK